MKPKFIRLAGNIDTFSSELFLTNRTQGRHGAKSLRLSGFLTFPPFLGLLFKPLSPHESWELIPTSQDKTEVERYQGPCF